MTSQYATAHLLEPALDAITLNRDTLNLIASPDDETTTLLGLLAQLANKPGDRQTMRQLIHLAGRLVNMNTEQLEHLKRIAGTADQIVSQQGRAQTRAQEPSRCSVKRLARMLRPPLANLRNPMIDAAGKRRAAQLVRDVLGECPNGVLDSREFCRTLGARNLVTLRGLLGVAA